MFLQARLSRQWNCIIYSASNGGSNFANYSALNAARVPALQTSYGRINIPDISFISLPSNYICRRRRRCCCCCCKSPVFRESVRLIREGFLGKVSDMLTRWRYLINAAAATARLRYFAIIVISEAIKLGFIYRVYAGTLIFGCKNSLRKIHRGNWMLSVNWKCKLRRCHI